jgi:hypothetical protein
MADGRLVRRFVALARVLALMQLVAGHERVRILGSKALGEVGVYLIRKDVPRFLVKVWVMFPGAFTCQGRV